jgi:hypothetical protein
MSKLMIFYIDEFCEVMARQRDWPVVVDVVRG